MARSCAFALAAALATAPASAQNGTDRSGFWMTTYGHSDGTNGCDIRDGTTVVSSEVKCGECVVTPDPVMDFLGPTYHVSCIESKVQSIRFNCSGVNCTDCTRQIDELNQCEGLEGEGDTTFGLAIEGPSLRDNLCAARATPAPSSMFVSHFVSTGIEPDKNCSMDDSYDYVATTVYSVPRDGCNESQYPGRYYSLNYTEVGSGENKTVVWSGGVDCSDSCADCRLTFYEAEVDECRDANEGSSVKLMTCGERPDHRFDEGPLYSAELLAVGVLVLVIGVFFILQSCAQRGKRLSTMTLNSTEEDEPLLGTGRPGYRRDNSGRVSFASPAFSATGESSAVAAPVVAPEAIAEAVAAEKADDLERQKARQGAAAKTMRV